ncbi:hypothetical protein L218DRAFT_646294 [Marasmius fiardii PR-910]|nr:hypothetical protein L218DRAFT_646294 [Marasmius fiardii PR-910]
MFRDSTIGSSRSQKRQPGQVQRLHILQRLWRMSYHFSAIFLLSFRTVPYEFVKNDIATGKGSHSLLANFLHKNEVNGGDKRQEDLIKDALTMAYAAGAETSVSVLLCS